MNLWLGEGPGRPPQRRSLSAGVIAGYFGSGAQGHPNKGYQLLPGFYAKSSTLTDAFLRLHSGRFITLAVPGASMTQAFGVNDRDEVVGAYTVGTGSSAVMHGFTWRPGHGFSTVDDPHGVGTTTINGVNDRGVLVGFYTDSAGNTDGMIATPRG
ncbi:MAG: hypothetical protein ABSB76_06650 [Streptosporangiaceae bacterium]